MLGSLLGTHVVQVKKCRRRARLTKKKRKEQEFLSLLEESCLSAARMQRLTELLEYFSERFTPEQWKELLSRASPSEVGSMNIPSSCRISSSRFLERDSEDPEKFLPVIEPHSEDAHIPVWERTLVKNASGHGQRIGRRHVGRH
jgi:hypothetical protein